MKIHISSRLMLYFALVFLGVSGFFVIFFYPETQGFYALVALAALVGFGVATNVWYTKKNDRQLVCPSGSDCNVVVNSRYSKFLGIKLEYMGMPYYGLIALIYLILIFAPGLLTEGELARTFLTGVMLLTAGAFLFSSYLLFVQAFLLKAWCIWCILASLMSMVVFIGSLVSLPVAVDFLTSTLVFFEMLQFLGYALGIGASSSAVFLFFKFLKDFRINDSEMNILQGVSELAWVGLGLSIMSKLAIYVTDPAGYAESGAFIAGMLALLVVGVGGAILMIVFAPFLVTIPFGSEDEEDEEKKEHRSKLAALRRPVFVSGSIALTSWYFAFVTNYLPELPLNVMVVLYVTVILTGVLASIALEKAVDAGKFA